MIQQPVILFDGECNLCTSSVQFVIERDPGAYFRFASLQSPAGKRLLAQQGLSGQQIDSVALIDGPSCFTKSDAALRIARQLSGWWPLLGLLAIVPRPLRDWGYDIVAANRYRWFGKQNSCMVPTPELRNRFLEETSGRAG